MFENAEQSHGLAGETGQSVTLTTQPHESDLEPTHAGDSNEPCETISQGSAPSGEILSAEDKEHEARSMSDADLLAKVEGAFRNWRENIPYIREARDRFAQPGRRVPVPGNPTWTEWVERYLGVGIRRVQQLLAGDQPKLTPKKAPKPSFAFAGLSESEVSEIVERGASITPETASRLMYNAVVRQPDLVEVRAVLKRCLDELTPAKQLEILKELGGWVEGQIYDLEHPEEKTAPSEPKKRYTFLDDDRDPNPTPSTIVEALEQREAMEAAAC
jgi:hypothetical protein